MKKIIYIALAFAMTISASAQVDRSIQPKPGPDPTINLAKPQSFTLSNGLKVLVVENHKLPRVTFSLTLDNPLSVEGDIKGVSYLASNMMGNGTSKISKDEYNEKLDYYGASVSFSTDNVSGNTLSRYFTEVFSLVTQGILDPLFTQDELDAERAKLLDILKSNEKNVQAIASNVRSTLLYGKSHPYGEYLSDSTINKVTLFDVKNYYKNNFVPGNAYLVIVGDVTFDEVQKLVTKDFASWKKAFAKKGIFDEPKNLKNTEINFVDVPTAVQSEISANNIVNLKMTDSDYFAALLANYILGGGGESRLFLNLRETHGWTYGSYSRISGDKNVTSFSAVAAVRNAVTDSAIVEMKKEMAQIRLMKPTQEELDMAKASYIGSFVMNAEKPQVIANFALKEETQTLPADFYKNYIKNIESVTLEQVNAAAQKYILNEGTRIVVVGKGTEVLPSLEKLGIPIKYFDRLGNPTVKPEIKAVSADITVEGVLSKYIDAIGGKTNLEKVNAVSYTAKGNIQGQEITLNKIETDKGNSKQMIEAMGMTLYKMVINDKGGYMEMQGQRQDLQIDEIEKVKKRGLFPELVMMRSLSNIEIKGIENIEGKEAYKIVDDKDAFFYDVNSGLKVAEETTTKSPDGNEIMTQRILLSNYNTVGDIKLPYTFTLNMGPGMEIVFNITEALTNQSLADDTFN